jgi:lipoyl(octanoyl) transferase
MGASAEPVGARARGAHVAEPGSPCRLLTRQLGRADYVATWRAMQAFTVARTAVTADEIWLTEHDPIYTLGLAGKREHVLRANGIAVLKVDRGGQVTYHGPGQLVVYVLFDLRRAQVSVRELIRRIESSVIEWLGLHGIPAFGKLTAPGVYAMAGGVEAKIAALGLRVCNGSTYHGLSVNVAMNLSPFADINPCGYPGLAVTQLADFDVARTVDQAGAELAPILASRLTPHGST